jgi:Glutathione S-transferase, C-terminal domain
MFRPTTPEEFKKLSPEFLGQRFDWIDKQLDGKQYLMGDKFTVADAYLFTVLQLVAARRHQSRQMAEHHRLFGPRRRPPEGARSDEGGRVGVGAIYFVIPGLEPGIQSSCLNEMRRGWPGHRRAKRRRSSNGYARW